MAKEDGSVAKEGETLNFRVTEFNKDTHHISLSHTRVWQAGGEEGEGKKKKAAAKKSDAAVNITLEKSTLGDISALAALKDKLSQGEK